MALLAKRLVRLGTNRDGEALQVFYTFLALRDVENALRRRRYWLQLHIGHVSAGRDKLSHPHLDSNKNLLRRVQRRSPCDTRDTRN